MEEQGAGVGGEGAEGTSWGPGMAVVGITEEGVTEQIREEVGEAVG